MCPLQLMAAWKLRAALSAARPVSACTRVCASARSSTAALHASTVRSLRDRNDCHSDCSPRECPDSNDADVGRHSRHNDPWSGHVTADFKTIPRLTKALPAGSACRGRKVSLEEGKRYFDLMLEEVKPLPISAPSCSKLQTDYAGQMPNRSLGRMSVFAGETAVWLAPRTLPAS